MNTSHNHLDAAPLLSEVPAENLAAISGGANSMLMDFKALTGVMFGDNGIFYTSRGHE